MTIRSLISAPRTLVPLQTRPTRLPGRKTPAAQARMTPAPRHGEPNRQPAIALRQPGMLGRMDERFAASFDQPYFAQLNQVAQQLHKGNIALARLLLGAIEIPDNDAPAELKGRLFKAALEMRATGKNPTEQQGNLYKTNFSQGGEQINLFNVMGTQMPLVTRTGEVVNEVLMQLMHGHDAVTLLDVGIGTGRQAISLLHALKASENLPKHLEIIGIEPGDGLLDRAEQGILGAAKELGINVNFVAHPGFVEDFDAAKWAELERPGRHLIINEGFAIHHLSYGNRPASDMRVSDDAKQDVLARLRALQPAAIILAEPDSDHQSDNVGTRFANAWHHYGKAFDVIDATAAIDTEVKVALKSFFFGRELLDVLGMPDSERTERHETAAMWKKRLDAAGFMQAPALTGVRVDDAVVALQAREPGVFSLAHAGAPVVSIVVRRGA